MVQEIAEAKKKLELTCFSTDRFEENHRGHIKIAKSCFVSERKEERPVNYNTAGLDHHWLKSTIAAKARGCSTVAVPTCLYIERSF